MKKLTSIFALVLCVIMLAGVVCFAADTTAPSVKPSVEKKQAPEVLKVVIIYSDGTEGEVSIESIIVTSYAESQTESYVSTEIKEQLDVAYIEVTAVDNLGELTEDLDKAVKEINSRYTDGLFVVTDLFDIWVSDGIKAYLENGGKIRVTFDTKYVEKPMVLHRAHNGEWEVIDPNKVTLNENGKVTVEFTSLSPVAFLSPSEDREVVTPTEDKCCFWCWILIIIIVILIIILIILLILLKKKKDELEKAKEETKDAAAAAASTEAVEEKTAEDAPAEEAPVEEAPVEEADAEEPKTEE